MDSKRNEPSDRKFAGLDPETGERIYYASRRETMEIICGILLCAVFLLGAFLLAALCWAGVFK